MKKNANKASLFNRLALQVVLAIAITVTAHAQDPVLPPTNLGLASVYDGLAAPKAPVLVFSRGLSRLFRPALITMQEATKTPSDLKLKFRFW